MDWANTTERGDNKHLWDLCDLYWRFYGKLVTKLPSLLEVLESGLMYRSASYIPGANKIMTDGTHARITLHWDQSSTSMVIAIFCCK